MNVNSRVQTLAAQIQALDADVLAPLEREAVTEMLGRERRRRCEAARQRDAAAWAEVRAREEWERFLAPRLQALEASLGRFPSPPAPMRTWTTGVVEGEGFRIENVVYESRPGVLVTANLYLPSPRRVGMPAILLVHSHHNPKTQGELQDMGMTWARTGCAVLVMDQLGYGERRQHRAGPRQEYRFRAITGMQLHLIGDSLMGWMVWDIRRGIDLLLGQAGVDGEKLILIGAVAGGGDPAAVAAALDHRVACAIPFNFGGPQPESPYPLPDDAETSFDTLGRGSWESTRNLRLSGRDGFLPWVIVAIAPRRLVYAHEFAWERERDPVWRRLQRVYQLYGVPERLAFAHGAGLLSGRPPEATHCNNVGAVHRRMLYPPLQRWFGMPEPEEYCQRLPEEALAGMGAPADGSRKSGAERKLGEDADPEISATAERLLVAEPIPTPRPLNALWAEIGAARAATARAALAELEPRMRRERLREEWARLLGRVEPEMEPVVALAVGAVREPPLPGARVERLRLTVEPGIEVPALLLLPDEATESRRAVVVAVAQDGKERFLRERAGEIAALLAGGAAVCLPDVRSTGETRPEGTRAPQSHAMAISATEWVMGETLLGARLRDLRSVLRFLRARPEIDPARLALWGDSFAPVNPPGFPDPLLGEEEPPAHSEPLGGLLALFGALYQEEMAAVAARGTLAGYLSVLRDVYAYVPHDAVVPGALTVGDLCDVAAALAPRPLRLEGLVDGRNCRLPEAEVRRLFEPTLRAYEDAGGALSVCARPTEGLAEWLLRSL